MKVDLEQLENKGRLNIFQTAFVFMYKIIIKRYAFGFIKK